MGAEREKRVKRPIERRRNRPRIIVTVTEPGQVIIDQGTREDSIDAPPGSKIERPALTKAAANP